MNRFPSIPHEATQQVAGLPWLAVAALAALPWLYPFVPGPSTSVLPWLVSFACGVMLWLAAAVQGARLRPALAAGALVLIGWPFIGHSPAMPEIAAWAGALTLLVLCASIADARAAALALRRGVLAAAAVSAGIALIQYFGGSKLFVPWISPARAGEAYGNLRQPNQLATLCAIGLALVLWDTDRWQPRWRLVLLVLLATGCAASVSRTGLLQFIALLGLAVAWSGPGQRDRLLLCAAGTLSYLLASALLPGLLEALTGVVPARIMSARLGGEATCSTRSVLWANVLQLIMSRPATGWGLGELDYAHFATLYEGPRFCDILDNAHNLPLHLAVELGIPAAAITSVGAAWWIALQHPMREVDPARRLAWALLLIVGLHSMLEYPLWYGPFQIVCGLAIGTLTRNEACAARHPLLPRGFAVGWAAVLLSGAVYAGWDYIRVSQSYLPAEQRIAAWRTDPMSPAQRSLLFSGHARFAKLTLTSITRENAGWVESTAEEMLHFSPEPRVIERLIESAVMNGHEDKALVTMDCYRAAFPEDYARWRLRHRQD